MNLSVVPCLLSEWNDHKSKIADKIKTYGKCQIHTCRKTNPENAMSNAMLGRCDVVRNYDGKPIDRGK